MEFATVVASLNDNSTIIIVYILAYEFVCVSCMNINIKYNSWVEIKLRWEKNQIISILSIQEYRDFSQCNQKFDPIK